MSSSFLGFHKLRASARKLVPFLPPKPISPLTAKEQDALLIDRLPPELRQLIWDTYFRGHAVHVYPDSERIRGRECIEVNAGDDSRGPHFDVCGKANGRCNHISLLLTCKKIYFECIRTLYGNTFFDFSHGVHALTIIPKRLPPANLALVSHVNLEWVVYHPIYLDKEEKRLNKEATLWVETWKALAAMQGLEWLRVELKFFNPWETEVWTDLEWSLWEGVKKVTCPPHFELILPFPAAASTQEETLPCNIIRVVDPRCIEAD